MLFYACHAGCHSALSGGRQRPYEWATRCLAWPCALRLIKLLIIAGAVQLLEAECVLHESAYSKGLLESLHAVLLTGCKPVSCSSDC